MADALTSHPASPRAMFSLRHLIQFRELSGQALSAGPSRAPQEGDT
jgi:hypothetical protein